MRTSEREIQLDVVRGVAILLAMGWHLNALTANPVVDFVLWPGRTFGWAGVDLFFVLSGFLIGGLVLGEVHRSGDFLTKRFFVRRALRLWPVLYLYVAGQLALARFPWTAFVPQILLHVQNYFPTPIAHLWSLAVEEQFYMVAGLLMPLAARRNVTPRTLVTILIMIIVVTIVARTIASFAGVGTYALQWQAQYRADGLALGVLLATLKMHYPGMFARLKAMWPWWLAVLFCGVGVLALVVPTDMPLLRPLVGFPAALGASGAFLLMMEGRKIPSLLKRPAAVLGWLGIYSYSIYIFHPGVGHYGGAKLARIIHHDTPAARVVLGYALAILVAYLVTKLVERPFMAIRDHLFPSARARTELEHIVDDQEGAARASA